jgi:hypothetical protein
MASLGGRRGSGRAWPSRLGALGMPHGGSGCRFVEAAGFGLLRGALNVPPRALPTRSVAA